MLDKKTSLVICYQRGFLVKYVKLIEPVHFEKTIGLIKILFWIYREEVIFNR